MNNEALQQARALLETGTTQFQSRNMSSALRSFEKALSIARAHKLPITEVKVLFGMGNVYKYQYRFRDALAVYQKALSIFRSNKNYPLDLDDLLDTRLESNILLSLGYAHSRLGQQRKAIEYTVQILEISPTLADAYYNLGCYFSILEDAENALEYLSKGKNLFNGNLIRASRTDPDLTNVRNDPRFRKIMYED
jgi:tetratricopeptide (TPR) repeat protein